MSDEERRDLIARQRSALYGEGAQYQEGAGFDENGTPRPAQGASGSIRGHSPLAFDHFNAQANQESQQAQEPQSATQGPGQQRSRANSTSSPSSNPTSSFGLFESTAQQQSSRTSTSSPGGSPPRQGKAPTSSGVAPIGTRPAQAVNPALKRSTTPLPSPLSYNYVANNEENVELKDKRTSSAASNPNQGNNTPIGGWPNKNLGWGKTQLGAQASVWG